MADVNKPFECFCGGTRFRELVQFTETCTTLPTDTATNPVIIECASLTRGGYPCLCRYRQTADWSWEHIKQGR